MEASPNQVKRPPLWAVLTLLLSIATPPLAGSTSAPTAEPRVLLISIDGLRPDVALRADMPNLRSMLAHGAFTFWATTTPVAKTLPSHASMLTGVTVERHGIKDNDDDAAAKMKWVVPTIFDLAKAAGISTGMVSGKSKFSLFNGPIDHLWEPDATKSFKRVHYGSTRPSLKASVVEDDVTGTHAVELVEDYRPRLMFVHFAMNDFIGHSKGWGTRAQVDNLAVTDRQIGRLFEALRAEGLFEQTTILLTADHGGSARNHGEKDDLSKFIPWLIQGPGVRPGLDLSLFKSRPIRTYDTFATLCDVLGLTTPKGIDGQAVKLAFGMEELLQSTSLPATAPSTEPTTAPDSLKAAGQ